MRIGILVAALIYCVPPTGAWGQSSCTIDPERHTIRDKGTEEAIVTYYNSSAECSLDKTVELTAPNGITVQVDIDSNAGGGQEEYIIVFPFGPDKIAIPPEAYLNDGETMEFLITGGTS